MTEISSDAGKLILLITFTAGFILGYKTKDWRVKYVKWKRDRHAKKLIETQKKLEELTATRNL